MVSRRPREVTASYFLFRRNLPVQTILATDPKSQPLIVYFGYSCPAIPRTWEFIFKDNLCVRFLFFCPSICWRCLMPRLGCIPAFGRRIEKKKRAGYREKRRESEFRNIAAPNPWVTSCEAQMSAYIKATGIVFKTTGAFLLFFKCAEAH